MEQQWPCPYCGKPLSPGAMFCHSCGARIPVPPPSQAPPPPGTEYFPAERRLPPAYIPRRRDPLASWLIGLAVVGCVLGPLMMVIIALPNFVKVEGKAKEAEVKQNLHVIQLALERFATDHDGQYPAYLYGGDTGCNIGTVNYFNPPPRAGAAYWDQPLHLPYDQGWLAGSGTDYADYTWAELSSGSVKFGGGAESHGLGDQLTFEGYLPEYPRNPFIKSEVAPPYSAAALNSGKPAYAGYGGRSGELMWNTGCFGELPQLKAQPDGSQQPRLDFPGQFFYHPRWADGASNSGHLEAAKAGNPGSWTPRDVDPAVAPPLNDSADVKSNDVAGYDLAAFGSPQTKGMDIENAVTGKGTQCMFLTGYCTLGQERNPWVRASDYPNAGDYSERPYSDSIPDYIIIRLTSGLDKKLGNPLRQKP